MNTKGGVNEKENSLLGSRLLFGFLRFASSPLQLRQTSCSCFIIRKLLLKRRKQTIRWPFLGVKNEGTRIGPSHFCAGKSTMKCCVLCGLLGILGDEWEAIPVAAGGHTKNNFFIKTNFVPSHNENPSINQSRLLVGFLWEGNVNGGDSQEVEAI